MKFRFEFNTGFLEWLFFSKTFQIGKLSDLQVCEKFRKITEIQSSEPLRKSHLIDPLNVFFEELFMELKSLERLVSIFKEVPL
jgi:hypothetical protein